MTVVKEGSSVGETRVCPDTGKEFEVVWGGGPLLGPRDTKNLDDSWKAPHRLYRRPDTQVHVEEITNVTIPEGKAVAVGDPNDQDQD